MNGEPLTLYGAPGSGAVAVEAAMQLLGIDYVLIEGATWADAEARTRVAPVNPMRQIPTLMLPGGQAMTESAAILIYLADLHPSSGLAPRLDDPLRPIFLRWMLYVSSAIYALHWIKPDVRRVGVPLALRDTVVDAVHERIAFCWSVMDQQLAPQGPYLLGEQLTVLDLYVNVVSRFGPWREAFVEAAPRMAPRVARVDADPRLAPLWHHRFSFE
ncbi:glutathione S-transferase family protein [Ideonella sp. DXS29W]|uniref:Glutathione S-transferase family protein n=1 Tax=Ideonella lacteola TaxID=2984193 RepID=A0ABU9BT92_9BURK